MHAFTRVVALAAVVRFKRTEVNLTARAENPSTHQHVRFHPLTAIGANDEMHGSDLTSPNLSLHPLALTFLNTPVQSEKSLMSDRHDQLQQLVSSAS